jgi:hypothetical protein
MTARKFTLTIETRMKTFKFRNVTEWSSARDRDGDTAITAVTTKGIKKVMFNDHNLLWIRED